MSGTASHRKKLLPARRSVLTPEVDFETLARQQGVSPIGNPEDLYGDFWPEEEDIEDFLSTVRQWRQEGE